MNKSKVIVIEGSGDGCGKSTQAKYLTENLSKSGIDVVKYHFPAYGTYHGALVEHYLRGDFGSPSECSSYFVNSLYAVDRAVAWRTVLKQSYLSGKYFLFDRYTTSSLIYQSTVIKDIQEKKDFLDYVSDYEYNKLGVIKPDLVLFLHLTFDKILELKNHRISNDGIANDIHERDIEFLKDVYENSLFVADYFSWDVIECTKDGEIRDELDISEDVAKLVKKIM